jgi:hypothetical protein
MKRKGRRPLKKRWRLPAHFVWFSFFLEPARIENWKSET